MTSERFEQLAGAYGADLGRWPLDERIAARAFLGAEPKAQAILDHAGLVDALLDRAPLGAPGAVLRERLIGLAPRPQRPIWRRGGAWISGAGLAAACVLGIMFGAGASANLMADPAAEVMVEASTAFDGADYFDVDSVLEENAG